MYIDNILENFIDELEESEIIDLSMYSIVKNYELRNCIYQREKMVNEDFSFYKKKCLHGASRAYKLLEKYGQLRNTTKSQIFYHACKYAKTREFNPIVGFPQWMGSEKENYSNIFDFLSHKLVLPWGMNKAYKWLEKVVKEAELNPLYKIEDVCQLLELYKKSRFKVRAAKRLIAYYDEIIDAEEEKASSEKIYWVFYIRKQNYIKLRSEYVQNKLTENDYFNSWIDDVKEQIKSMDAYTSNGAICDDARKVVEALIYVGKKDDALGICNEFIELLNSVIAQSDEDIKGEIQKKLDEFKELSEKLSILEPKVRVVSEENDIKLRNVVWNMSWHLGNMTDEPKVAHARTPISMALGFSKGSRR